MGCTDASFHLLIYFFQLCLRLRYAMSGLAVIAPFTRTNTAKAARLLTGLSTLSVVLVDRNSTLVATNTPSSVVTGWIPVGSPRH